MHYPLNAHTSSRREAKVTCWSLVTPQCTTKCEISHLEDVCIRDTACFPDGYLLRIATYLDIEFPKTQDVFCHELDYLPCQWIERVSVDL